jgi:hypothetical protein
MEINKLTNHISGQTNSTHASEGSQSASKITARDRSHAVSDKVSLENFSSKKSEELFAKIELEKINHASFEKLKGYKMKLQEYEAAKQVSPEKAGNTEIGKMLNDPDVWSKIAQNISDE